LSLANSRDAGYRTGNNHIAAESASLLFFISFKSRLIFSDIYPKNGADKNKWHRDGKIDCWQDEQDSPNSQHLPYCEHGQCVRSFAEMGCAQLENTTSIPAGSEKSLWLALTEHKRSLRAVQ
jgi:hypothetical protein